MKISLELADTPAKRAQGLMGRKSLHDDTGMIFIFPNRRHQSFWMQNTYLPLDIAFLKDDGSIFQISQMSPLSTRFTSSEQPCKFAVEMNEGWFEKNNISVGFQLFNNTDWVRTLKASTNVSLPYANFENRYAQVQVENEEINMEQHQLDGELTPEQEADMFGQDDQEILPENEQMYEQPQQPNQVVEYNMDQAAKIKLAEQNNQSMDIVYWTLSGRVLPPRRLIPVQGEGYPIKSGPNGRYFVGYDSSPTITGNGWDISGGTPKNFLIDNIISLDLVQDEGESNSEVEQTIEEPKNLWDRLRNTFSR